MVICFGVVRLFSTDPNLYLKLGRLGSADKEKLLGCCIFASPLLSPALITACFVWGSGMGRLGCREGELRCREGELENTRKKRLTEWNWQTTPTEKVSSAQDLLLNADVKRKLP